MQVQQVAIYGAGGSAREIAWLAEVCNQGAERLQVVCFIDDAVEAHGKLINEVPVFGLPEARAAFPLAKVVAGVGQPRLRERLMDKAAQAGFQTRSLVHPRTELSRFAELGEGCVICAGNIITTNTRLGRHVQVNFACTIAHDVQIGDYATLAPGVHISGNVHLGKRVYVGTGAVIVNGKPGAPLVIEDDVVIGAGACVTKSIARGLTVVGVPARPRVP
jgi:sugar O-acyltransferase (sialic acid O-acetyltransferase NeuD family)